MKTTKEYRFLRCFYSILRNIFFYSLRLKDILFSLFFKDSTSKNDKTAPDNDQEEKENWVMEQVKNEINEVKKREEADKLARTNAVTTQYQQTQQQPTRQKKRYTRANSEKLFNDIENDLEDLMDDDSTIFVLIFKKFSKIKFVVGMDVFPPVMFFRSFH